MKREVPLAITFIVGVVVLIQWFVPHEPIGSMGARFSQWFDIIASFAIILGGLNLLKLQSIKVQKRHKDAPYAMVTIIGFAITAFVGFAKTGGSQPGNPLFDPGSHFVWVWWNTFVPLSATMFALLAFFVASASYRAFRARNTEATVLLVAGIILMLGRVPLGKAMTDWLPEYLRFLHIPKFAEWIFQVPNTAGARAIMIGIALGIVSTSLRLILGIERSYLGGDEK
jgi:hypothetical protein